MHAHPNDVRMEKMINEGMSVTEYQKMRDRETKDCIQTCGTRSCLLGGIVALLCWL